MMIFSGSSNRPLAERIVAYLKTELGQVELTRFADGELLAKFKANVRGKDVFIIQSICRPPNENLMELLIMIDAAKRASAARITAVLPFYGYARQDRKDQPRVPITAKLVANLLEAAGAMRILSMDFHSQQIQGFFDMPCDHLYAMPVIVEHLLKRRLKDPVVVTPDSGGVKMAIGYAEMLGAGLALGAKYRRGRDMAEAINVVGDVKGRTCIMVDDLVSTARTLCDAARVLKKNGAGDIYAVVSHLMVSQEGLDRLAQSPIRELITTDTIPYTVKHRFQVTVLTVSGLLGEAIARIHGNRSVTSLFRLKNMKKGRIIHGGKPKDCR